MKGSFRSGAFTLANHLVVPAGPSEPRPGVLICHGFPIGPLDARRSAGTFPQLADRIAYDLGYVAMTFNFRGTGSSTGDFSLQGWVDDLRSAIDFLVAETHPTQVVLVGMNTGGSIAICVAADDPACGPPRCSGRDPTSTTGRSIPDGSSNMPGRSAPSRRRGSRPRSRNGAGRSVDFARPIRHGDLPPDRSW